MDSPIFLFV